MSTPNPLIPQGSLQHKAGGGNSNVRIAVATIVGIHVVFFGGLLLQGCKRDVQVADADSDTNAEVATPTYNYPPLTNDTSSLYYDDYDSLPQDQGSVGQGSLSQGNVNQGNVSQSTVSTQAQSTGYEPLNTYTPTPTTPTTSTAVTPSTGVSSGGNLYQPSTSSGFGAAPAPTPMKEYTVVRGDSFYKIAKDHGTTIKALTDANPGIEPSRLQIGAKVKIPASEPSRATGSTPGGSETNNANVYTVKSGDTLTRIAQRHGTTVSALRAANGLRTSRLLVGQKLKIPTNGTSNATSNGRNL